MAGPSAADVRSILSLPNPNTPGPSQLRKQPGTTERARKPEGISRELYSLIGPSAPTLAAQLAKPRLKQKPNLGGGGRVKWEWRTFKNGARKDSLKLSHWAKAGSDPEAASLSEYNFANYNVQPNVFLYSQDEYSRHLTDSEWTKEETDYLFNLVREFDLRWYVIADRYDYPGGQPRTMEDLKDRYASVCRKLIRNRPWAGDEASKSQMLSSFSFDKDRELLRKQYVASLENRTQEQILEEEALFIEIKRLEQNERRFKKDREELLRTLMGMESGLPDIIVDEDAFSAPPAEVKKTKKKNASTAEAETPTSAVASTSSVPHVPKKQSAKSAAYDVPQTALTTTKAAHQPVFLRSYKLPVPKSSTAPKITAALSELGVRSDRLVMPTKDNCGLLESLLDATSSLVEMKKQMDRLDHEIRVAQERLAARNAEGNEDHAEGDMEVDEDADADAEGVEVTGEDTREQSVVSARSARSTKAARKTFYVDIIGGYIGNKWYEEEANMKLVSLL
ncbi:hypothetical protein EIP86_003911 [Pleurotus ostreatoroseus]|nr:hypothetical protein EIP86_003911 [Pleurotus ostreatoroseus]